MKKDVHLEEAVLGYARAVVAVEQAESQLVELLKSFELSDAAISAFVQDVQQRAQSIVQKFGGSSGDQFRGGAQKPVSSQPSKRAGGRSVRGAAKLRVLQPGQFEWDAQQGQYLYNLDGRTKKAKYLPLLRFRKTVLAFADGDRYATTIVGKPGRSTLNEGIAVKMVQNLINEIKAGEISKDEYEVFAGFIKGVMHRMRPLARDVLTQLLEVAKG